MRKFRVIHRCNKELVCSYYNLYISLIGDQLYHHYDDRVFNALKRPLELLYQNLKVDNVSFQFSHIQERSLISIQIVAKYKKNKNELELLLDGTLHIIDNLESYTVNTNNKMIINQSFGEKYDLFENDMDCILLEYNKHKKFESYEEYVRKCMKLNPYIVIYDCNALTIINDEVHEDYSILFCKKNIIKKKTITLFYKYSAFMMVAFIKCKKDDFYKWKLVEGLLSIFLYEYIKNKDGFAYIAECNLDYKREIIRIVAYIDIEEQKKITDYMKYLCLQIRYNDFGKEKFSGLKICMKDMVRKMFDTPRALITFLYENEIYQYLTNLDKFEEQIDAMRWDDIKKLVSTLEFPLHIVWRKKDEAVF